MAYDFDFELCVVCLRVADMPMPRMPSVRRKCAHCHAPIWVAKEAPAATKACLQCVTRAGASAIRRGKSVGRGLREIEKSRRGGRGATIPTPHTVTGYAYYKKLH